MTSTRSVNQRNRILGEPLLDRYLLAKETVIRKGFAAELDWQDQQSIHRVKEPDFLCEIAWVILSSGMRETVVRRVFGNVSIAFLNWQSGAAIAARATECIRRAAKVFAHGPKLRAIADVAKFVGYHGFEDVKATVLRGGVECFTMFAFIGPVTQFHLAKNLGMDVVKPDRHLVRLAQATGYRSPTHLCETIAALTGDRLSVIDLVLWRYATIEPDYELVFGGIGVGCEAFPI